MKAWSLLVVLSGCCAALHGASVVGAGSTPGTGGAPALTEKSGAPSAAKGRGKGPRPDFWAGILNHADSFNNRGIASFQHVTIRSKVINFKGGGETEVGYTIYLPPDYGTSDERYPVLYFLHGLGGTENTVAPVVEKAHALITKRELPPFIIVSAATGRAFYGNQFEGKFQVHDFYFQEFIPHIDRTYRTRTERRFRHIQGFSMGGYGALMYGLKHPDLFGTVTDIGGALGAARNNYFKEMYDAKEEHYRPFDLHWLTGENADKMRDLRIAIWIGSEDIVRMANVQYHGLLTAKSIPHHYNDWNARPKLEGVGHSLPRYFEAYGKEILEFHTEAFQE